MRKTLEILKKTWSEINKILSRKGNKQNGYILSDNGKFITDQKQVANKFNHFFTNVAENLSKSIKKGNTKYQDYLKNPNESSLFLKGTTPHELNLILQQMDSKKSIDIYGISTKCIKLAGPDVIEVLSSIFNRSILEGIFPNALKLAKIIPIHKGVSQFETSNYRPIFLLPIVSKIFEKLIFNRLNDFLSKHKILSPNQFGFQKNNSTEFAVNAILTKITNAFENKETAYTVFLDFAKAFDTVNSNILISKMEHYGIRGVCLNLFKNYLANRQQCTEINGTISDIEITKCGVPQGSILGPILFLIYINDIVNSSKLLKFYLFADDTTLFYSSKNKAGTEDIVNREIGKVTNWLISNKLSLNIKKSCYLTFSLVKRHQHINIKINNQPIEEKSYTKYLGVIIDNKLTWKDNIKYINCKLRKGTGILYKIRDFVPRNIMTSLYFSFIQPYVDYNILNWSATNKTNLECIRISLKKAVRIISFKQRLEHSAPLLQNLEILPLDHIQKKLLYVETCP